MPTHEQAHAVNAEGEPLFKAHKFLGFEVVGYPPGTRSQADEAGVTLDAWRSKHKPKRISVEPMVTHDGAMQMKALAEKEGWIHVSINELIKAKK